MSRKTLNYNGPINQYTPPNLEDEINKLVEQGWILERFQTVSSPDGTGYGEGSFKIFGYYDVIALLKRARK